MDKLILPELAANLLHVAKKIKTFEDAQQKMNDWALARVQQASIPTPAYIWAVENEMDDPAEFQQEAQNKADYLESVLLSDSELTPGQRAVATIAITFFETCGVLNDSDIYGSDRAGLVQKCKLFAYGPVDRAKEQETDAARQMGETLKTIIDYLETGEDLKNILPQLEIDTTSEAYQRFANDLTRMTKYFAKLKTRCDESRKLHLDGLNCIIAMHKRRCEIEEAAEYKMDIMRSVVESVRDYLSDLSATSFGNMEIALKKYDSI